MNKNAAYLLVNYRRIHNDFQKMKPEDKEYNSAKQYLDTMQIYLNRLTEAELPQTNFLEKSKLTTNQVKSLCVDTINMAYITSEYKSSVQMINIIKKKYGLNLSASRFTLLKEYAIDFFSSILPN